MSEATFEDFEGEWIVEDLPYPDMSDPGKMAYYPPKGQILTFTRGKIKHSSMGSVPYKVPYFTVTADPDKPSWDGRIAMANAKFLFAEGLVTSTQIPTDVNMPSSGIKQTIHEVIMLDETRTKMIHAIIWQDGDLGKWGCTKKV